MSFQKNKYHHFEGIIPPLLAEFCSKYIQMKKANFSFLKAAKYISPFNIDHGYYIDPQVPNTYAIFGDQAMETLFDYIKPELEKVTKLKLVETYAYARVYKKGDILKKHTDRSACEITTTLNLGGDLWPIYVSNKKFVLKPGDMLAYKGCELEHWRNSFQGNMCVQVFHHFNSSSNSKVKENKYDSRPMLGLPVYFKTKKVND
jgi:hypothetical protein